MAGPTHKIISYISMSMRSRETCVEGLISMIKRLVGIPFMDSLVTQQTVDRRGWK